MDPDSNSLRISGADRQADRSAEVLQGLPADEATARRSLVSRAVVPHDPLSPLANSGFDVLTRRFNLLMLTHSFRIELNRDFGNPPMDPFPSQSPSDKLKFRIAEQRHDLSA